VAAPVAWGWGLSWTDIALAVFFYFFTLAGTTVGFHRYRQSGIDSAGAELLTRPGAHIEVAKPDLHGASA
jgi:hypothetical protein